MAQRGNSERQVDVATIAWIEDNYKNIGSLVKLLERDGHAILPFGSLQEVEKEIETICASDAVILDIILPVIEDDPYLGISALKLIRKRQKHQVPIVVCSGVSDPEVLRRLEELGVTEILLKPVRPSVLYSVVIKAMGGY